MTQRSDRLITNNTPRYIRIYDNGGSGSAVFLGRRILPKINLDLNGSVDRYTCVFTGNYPSRSGCDYISMSATPNNPTYGFCQHGWHSEIIDRPSYSHLGKAIAFTDLPEACQSVVLHDYKQTWSI